MTTPTEGAPLSAQEWLRNRGIEPDALHTEWTVEPGTDYSLGSYLSAVDWMEAFVADRLRVAAQALADESYMNLQMQEQVKDLMRQTQKAVTALRVAEEREQNFLECNTKLAKHLKAAEEREAQWRNAAGFAKDELTVMTQKFVAAEERERELRRIIENWETVVGYAGVRPVDPGSLQGFIEGLWSEKAAAESKLRELEARLEEK
jgi:hypothetical protein